MPTLVQNRKARHDYDITERFEAGIALTGTEVKSCRAHNIALADAHVRVEDGELWLVGAHIAPYEQGNRGNHDPRRDRKLLMHRREIRQIARALAAKGMTLVPLRMYTVRNRIKVELGLGRGRREYDKRQALRREIHEREAQRAVQARRRRGGKAST